MAQPRVSDTKNTVLVWATISPLIIPPMPPGLQTWMLLICKCRLICVEKLICHNNLAFEPINHDQLQ